MDVRQDPGTPVKTGEKNVLKGEISAEDTDTIYPVPRGVGCMVSLLSPILDEKGLAQLHSRKDVIARRKARHGEERARRD